MNTTVVPLTPDYDNPFYDKEDFDIYIELYLKIYRFRQILSILCFSIIFIVGSIGNGLVIWIAVYKMKTISAVWFLNLAIADLICNMTLLLHIAQMFCSLQSMEYYFLCITSSSMLVLNMFTSVSFLTAISIDRCVSIMWPFRAQIHRTRRLASTIAIIIWILSLILITPFFFLNVEYFDDFECYHIIEKIYQYLEWEGSKRNQVKNAVFLSKLIFMFLIPFTIMLSSYGLIVIKLRTTKRPNRSKRPFRIITAIVICFSCCWLPYHLWPFIPISFIHVKTNLILGTICNFLAYFNSCLNPILYVLLSKGMKGSFIKSIPARLENAFRDRFDINYKDEDKAAGRNTRQDTSF